MLTAIDAAMLTEAFPARHHSVAVLAGQAVSCILAPQQWTTRFSVQVDEDTVLIPVRLHFGPARMGLTKEDEAWLFARALQTRSGDGFERQRAARDLMVELRPWAASFVVALIGEYIVEILEDITAALTPDNTQTLAAFIIQNEAYWATTKRRVASYWNAYYRSGIASETRFVCRRGDYSGFKLIDRLEMAAFGRAK